MRDHSHEREVAVRGRSEGLKRRRCGGRVEVLRRSRPRGKSISPNLDKKWGHNRACN